MKDQLTIKDLLDALEKAGVKPDDKLAYCDLQLAEYTRVIVTKTDFGWTIEGRR